MPESVPRPSTGAGVRVARGDARHVRAVVDSPDRTACGRFGQVVVAGANARAAITLGVVKRRLTLREAGRVAVAGGVEERMRLVDALVDDRRSSCPDPQSEATARPRGRRRRSTPGPRSSVTPKLPPTWTFRTPVMADRSGTSRAASLTASPLSDDRVTPADRRGWDAGADASLDCQPLALQFREVAAARGGVEVEAPRLGSR